ncbi:MAG TPA: S49 family peptidase [Rhizomicrobium sp.]
MNLHPSQIARKIINRPLLLHPASAQVVLWALREHLGANISLDEGAKPEGPEATRFVGSRKRKGGGSAMTRAHNGVGLISIVGELVNRGAWLDASSGLVSYEGIAAQLKEAAADPEIHSILLDIDSPGGEALGMSTIAGLVRSVNSVKPVTAVVNDMAASAAYGIASGAKEIVVSNTSLAGSIGVLLMHVDYSQYLAKEGIKPTLIYAGAHKVDGNPFGPLSEQVTEDLKQEVLAFYDDFLASVAAGRGAHLDASAARATEARIFMGKEAVAKGVADRVGTFDQVLQELSTRSGVKKGQTPNGGLTMKTYTEEEYNAGVAAARTEGVADGEKKGREAGATAERERMSAILTSEEAKGREGQAATLAATSVTAEEAKKVLASTPVGSKTPTIEQRNNKETEVGATIENGGKKDFTALWDKSVANHNRRFGAKR